MSLADTLDCLAQWRSWSALVLMIGWGPGTAAGNDPLKLLTYPTRPIKVVVSWPAQGSADVLARAVTERLELTLKQRVHVENRPGAGGNAGAEIVARAPADGHTLLLTAADTLVINPHLPALRTTSAGIAAFEPVALIAHSDVALVVHAAVQVHSVGQLINYARANPGRITFGTSGPGTRGHLLTQLLQQRMDLQVETLAMQGSAAAAAAVAGGTVHAVFSSYSVMEPYLRAKKINLLALGSRHGASTLQLADSPIAEFELDLYFGLFAPGSTPTEIVERLNLHVNRAIATPGVRTRLATLGFEADPISPVAFARMLQIDSERWLRALTSLRPPSQ